MAISFTLRLLVCTYYQISGTLFQKKIFFYYPSLNTHLTHPMGFWEPILGLSRAWKSAQKGEILKGSPISKSQDIFGRNFGNFSPILTKLAPDDPWGELWGLATLDCWFSRTVGRNHPKCTKTLVFIWLGWNLVGRSIFAFHEDCRFSRFLTPQGGTVGRNPPKCTKKIHK